MFKDTAKYLKFGNLKWTSEAHNFTECIETASPRLINDSVKHNNVPFEIKNERRKPEKLFILLIYLK